MPKTFLWHNHRGQQPEAKPRNTSRFSKEIFFSVDIETNGGRLDQHSMLCFAAVAYILEEDGVKPRFREVGATRLVLEPTNGHTEDKDTMAWWATQPEAFKIATTNPESPKIAMHKFASWCLALQEKHKRQNRVLVYYPTVFDGAWMDLYCLKYLGSRDLFWFAAYDIKSFASGLLGYPWTALCKEKIPLKPYVEGVLTHDPIDDARQQGRLFGNLLIRRVLDSDRFF